MPSESVAQQRFMGMNLARQRKTGHNATGMSEQQLKEFAGTKTKGLPQHASPRHAAKRRRKKLASAFMGKAPKQSPMIRSMNQPGAMPEANQGMSPSY